MDTREQSLGRWISILYRYGQTYLDNELEPYGISSGQFMFLATLFAGDGISQEAIATRLKIDKGTTARAISKLEEVGYVIRAQDPRNKRAKVIFLTLEGRELFPVIKAISEKWTETLTAGFSPAEKKMAAVILEKMAGNIV